MRKKITSQEEFDRYWKSHINEVIRRKVEFVINSHQKEILKFRKDWKIPIGGLTNRRAYNKWLKTHEDDSGRQKKLVYQREGERLLETQRLEVKIPDNLILKKSEIQSIKIGSGFFPYFRQRVLEFGYEIGLDNTWSEAFENYLLTNNLDMRRVIYLPVEISEKVSFSHNGTDIGRKIALIFGANTTLDDIKLAWKYQIEPLIKTLPGYLSHPPRRKRLSRH